MSIHRPSLYWLRDAYVLAIPAMLAAGGTAYAADRERPAPATSALSAAQPPRQSDPDFLFGRPRAFVGVSGGWLVASQDGGIFDFTRDLLTVDEGDFNAATFRVSAGLTVAPRLDAVAEFGFSGATSTSEYRDFVDSDDLPIVQTTELNQAPVSGSLRVWLTPRGREVGRFAWVPSRVSLYTGAGGGAQWYRFKQFGDFVDFVDLSIFNDVLESSGWTASGHVLAGASVSVTERLFIGIETRYVWANTPLSGDFVGFDNIDLNGLHSTVGIELVF
jgi:opacity protein-like surface antigen